MIRRGLIAGAIAALPSGLPSTIYALAMGRDPLEATEAAGTLVLGDDAPRYALIAAAVPVHVALSLWWGCVLAAILPQRKVVMWGAFAGLGIAAFDLGVVGRRFERIRALPLGPQIADHIAFSTLAALVIRNQRS